MRDNEMMAQRMRYAYIKSGDAVEELQKIGTLPEGIPDGGPDAYVAGLLHMAGQQPTLVLSGGRRYASLVLGNITARVYPKNSRTLRPFGTVIVQMFTLLAAVSCLLRFRPDRILCGRRKGALLWASYMASRMLSRPLVCSCHGQVKFKQRPWYRQIAPAIDRWILRHASAVICHGPYLKEHLLDIGISPTRLYEFNAGFRDIFSSTESPDNTLSTADDPEKQVILFVGRVQANKGVFDLLDACVERLVMYPNLRLVYVGEGSHLRELQALVSERGLTRQVQFKGKVPHNTIGDIVRGSTLLVTPTRSSFPEGRCMAAIEGLVMGVPVIAPDSGPFPYMIEHGVNGLLFRTDSVDDLRRMITSVLEDEDLYNRLRTGAQESGKNLIDPPLIFTQAVERAFASQQAG